MTPGQNLKKTGPTPEVKEGLHKCTLCDSSFETVSGLHGHMNVHNKKYSCHLCGKCFRGPFAVQEHLKTHAGPSVKKETRDPILFPLECKVCKHRFANAITLRQHRNLHTERYQCDICGQSNKNADGLKRHMRKHTGEKPFGCRKCEYRSTRNSDIIRHEKTCNGKKRNQPLVVIRDEHAMKDDAVGMGLEMFLQASTSSEDDTRQDGFVGDYQERESSEASIGRMILVKEESDEFIQPAYEPQIDQPPIEGPSFVLSPQEMLLQIVKQEDKNIMDTDRPEDVASSNSNDHVDFETIDDCEEAIHAVDLFEEKPPIMSSVFEDDPTAKIEELTRLNEKLVQENLELRQMFSAELEKLKRNNTRLREENRRLKQTRKSSQPPFLTEH